MSAFLSLGQSVFALGFETESIIKLNSFQVQQIGAYLMQSGKGNISLTNQEGPQNISLGKANIFGFNYDLQTSMQSLSMNNGYLLATFGQIDSVIRIPSITYNDVVHVEQDGFSGDFRVSFQCKNISARLTASQSTLSVADINTASLDYSQLQASNVKIESCSGINDAAQMVTSTQQELIKQLQDPKFFNEVYKPQIMPVLTGLIMSSTYESKVGEKTIQIQARDMKMENGYLLLASDIHISDPTFSEVHDYRVNQVNEGINISKPFIFSLFNDVAFKGQKVLSIPSKDIEGLDDIRDSWFLQFFVLPELLSYPTGTPLHVEVQQVSDVQFYVALVAETKKGNVRVIAAYMEMKFDLDGFANDNRDFLRGVKVVRGSSRFDFFADYFIDYVNEQMSAYRKNIFEHLQIPSLTEFGIRINLVD